MISIHVLALTGPWCSWKTATEGEASLPAGLGPEECAGWKSECVSK